MFEEALERFHQFDHRYVCAIVDELMVGISSVCPAPSISEGVELRLAYLPTRLAEENVIIGVGIERRI